MKFYTRQILLWLILGRLSSDMSIELTWELIMSCLVHFPLRFWAGNKEDFFLYLEADT